VNRGPEPAPIHLMPSLWFRNTWTWWQGTPKPSLRQLATNDGWKVIAASHAELGERYLYCEGDVPLLFTENETNNERVFDIPNLSPYVKDGINDYVVAGSHDAVNPEKLGTKAAAHYQFTVAPGETITIRLRLTDLAPNTIGDPFKNFDATLRTRLGEADAFYKLITPEGTGEDEALILRQALAGMLWTKQYFFFDVGKWLEEHGVNPMKRGGRSIRNREWFHMVNRHVISMPDKWEYPWYAAWDLAFHTIALSAVDTDFAKEQLDLMLQEFFLHPTGQIPAYEWNFSDVNPPVHAWATIFLYRMEQALYGKGDIEFLKRSFPKLMLNFSWWVNRKDRFGNNLFEGGFLGLDNIGVFDRSSPLPTGGSLEQADGTAWVCMFAQNMLEIAVELTAHDPVYEDMAVKFAEHFIWIAGAMNQSGHEGMWDEEDGFYYDVLLLPDGSVKRLKVRSMVGLLPLCATTVIEQWQLERMPRVMDVLQERAQRMPGLRSSVHAGLSDWGFADRSIAALVNEKRLRRILTRVVDEKEFLSPYGIRALSRYHEDHPYVVNVDGREYSVKYLAAESDNGMFGGNSNWRGPVWMPMNVLLIRALLQFYLYYGDKFKIECPTGSGNLMNLFEVAREIADRLTRIFLRDESGRRPVFGGTEKFQTDPHWKDYILFYEYFHGDNGAGLGAGHQTGWTGLVVMLTELFGRVNPELILETGKSSQERRTQAAPSAAYSGGKNFAN
jgi:Glycosyl hydrolase family 63 C-terminal domain